MPSYGSDWSRDRFAIVELQAYLLESGSNNPSQLKTCRGAAHNSLISKEEAIAVFDHQREIIEKRWNTVFEEAELGIAGIDNQFNLMDQPAMQPGDPLLGLRYWSRFGCVTNSGQGCLKVIFERTSNAPIFKTVTEIVTDRHRGEKQAGIKKANQLSA